MCHFAFQTQVKEMISPSYVSRMFALDFNEQQAEEKLLSVEDRRFLKIMSEGVLQLEDGNYEMPLPLKSENVELLHSKELALSCLLKLRRTLTSDEQFLKGLQQFHAGHHIKWLCQRVQVEELSTKSKQVPYKQVRFSRDQI